MQFGFRSPQQAPRAIAKLLAPFQVIRDNSEKLFGDTADLFGGSIVDSKHCGSAADIDAEGVQRESARINPLFSVPHTIRLPGCVAQSARTKRRSGGRRSWTSSTITAV